MDECARDEPQSKIGGQTHIPGYQTCGATNTTSYAEHSQKVKGLQ